MKKYFLISLGLFALFAIWTVLVCLVDRQPIGPLGSEVGLATVNQWFHAQTGVHFKLYNVTDWLGLVPIGICAGFGLLGLIQWVSRKSIRRVDADLIVLGVFYLVTIATFVLFEHLKVNYRPVLIEGVLEASYPSSTTMLTMCVMPTTIIQLQYRLKNARARIALSVAIWLFTSFMVLGRLISGVHWFSDILGGALFSAGLVMIYYAADGKICRLFF